MNVVKRLARELKEMKHTPPSNCSAEPIHEDNMYQWKGSIIGPENTPYAGGRFNMIITFPDEYPFKPPRIHFTTPIYHCNFSAEGAICLDILKNNWAPALSIGKVMLSICSLLDDANPDSALSLDIAQHFKQNRADHDRVAREWTLQFARIA